MHFFNLLSYTLSRWSFGTLLLYYTLHGSHIDTTALIVTGNITSLVVLILCSRYSVKILIVMLLKYCMGEGTETLTCNNISNADIRRRHGSQAVYWPIFQCILQHSILAWHNSTARIRVKQSSSLLLNGKLKDELKHNSIVGICSVTGIVWSTTACNIVPSFTSYVYIYLASCQLTCQPITFELHLALLYYTSRLG